MVESDVPEFIFKWLIPVLTGLGIGYVFSTRRVEAQLQRFDRRLKNNENRLRDLKQTCQNDIQLLEANLAEIKTRK